MYKRQNLYRAVELFLKYRPNIPMEFQQNELYGERTVEQWSKVKVEKADRSEFHKSQRVKKYTAKEVIERHAFDVEVGI